MRKSCFFSFALSAAFVLLNLSTSVQAELVLYEGFDYTGGSSVGTLNGGLGWDTAWASAGAGTTFHTIAPTGLTLGAHDAVGLSAVRATRNGTSEINRTTTTASTTSLTADNSTAWFSVLMSPLGNPGNGFELNTYGTLIFGDAVLGAQPGAAAAPSTGSAVGVGFAGRGPGLTADNVTYANMRIQGVTYDSGTLVADNQTTVGGVTSLIVGQIDWAANGTNDTISLYNVLDPTTVALPAAFSTMTVDLDQSTFDVISISAGQTSIFDEIRFGTTLVDVLPASAAVPEPSSIAVLGFASLAFLRRRRA